MYAYLCYSHTIDWKKVMLDFLSNSNWLTPQIDFLLFLQGIREISNPVITNLLSHISQFGEYFIATLICVVVYWCIDARNGIYMFTVFGINIIITHLFKLIACVYRPWIINDKIQPPQNAFGYARSYSFPSGHSANSSSLYGALAFILRKHFFIAILLVLLVLLVGFSRLWLGVHTPQDVVVGLAIGFILVLVVHHIINWAEKDKNRYLYLLAFVNLFTIAATIYICYFANYPMDYINGELLVNPLDAVYVTVVLNGYVLGILNGAFLCRRYFPFEAAAGSVSKRILRGLLGTVIVFLLMKYVFEGLFMNTFDFKIAVTISYFLGLLLTAVYPYIFSRILKL